MKEFRDINHFALEGDLFSENVPDYMFLPQVYWLGNSEDYTKATAMAVDDVFKIESLNTFNNAIEKKLQLGIGEFDIPISNVTTSLRAELNTETISIIQEAYRQDFELFGYDKLI